MTQLVKVRSQSKSVVQDEHKVPLTAPPVPAEEPDPEPVEVPPMPLEPLSPVPADPLSPPEPELEERSPPDPEQAGKAKAANKTNPTSILGAAEALTAEGGTLFHHGKLICDLRWGGTLFITRTWVQDTGASSWF